MSKLFALRLKFSKYLILVLALCFLVVLQLAFFPHFKLLGAELNLIFIAVFLLGFFGSPVEGSGRKQGEVSFLAALVGGLLLDIFSVFPFGVFTLTFLALSFLMKKSHGLFHKSNPLAFVVVFLLSFLFYKVCLWVLIMFLVLVFESKLLFTWPVRLAWLVELLYNFFVAGLAFSVVKLKKSK